jgi:hypothetical protein
MSSTIERRSQRSTSDTAHTKTILYRFPIIHAFRMHEKQSPHIRRSTKWLLLATTSTIPNYPSSILMKALPGIANPHTSLQSAKSFSINLMQLPTDLPDAMAAASFSCNCLCRLSSEHVVRTAHLISPSAFFCVNCTGHVQSLLATASLFLPHAVPSCSACGVMEQGCHVWRAVQW